MKNLICVLTVVFLLMLSGCKAPDNSVSETTSQSTSWQDATVLYDMEVVARTGTSVITKFIDNGATCYVYIGYNISCVP
jgi:uncharacterized lipoprotein YajG